ncbi:ice-binding family protein, partial [Micromonospora sp. NPDC050495]|uniref:ice-binding family protein n=1 Tax=Micromonospora sp. NPDC050495 TaxID=3154936 RepID=UPI003406EED0
MTTVAAGGAAVAVLVISGTGASAAEAPVSLGTAANFSVLAGSTATNTGPSFLAQSLGVHPGNTAPGFPPGIVGGEIHLGDAVALQAKNDLTTAYNDAAGRTPFTNLPSELGGSTLTPGVYRIGAAQLTGTLTLNSQNDPAAVFIFQIASTLVTAANSSVVFINGASPCNVYWQVGSSATLGTGTRFMGNILAQTSITMNTGATLQGRALAQTGAVTLDTNTINAPVCLQPTGSPTTSPTGTPT